MGGAYQEERPAVAKALKWEKAQYVLPVYKVPPYITDKILHCNISFRELKEKIELT